MRNFGSQKTIPPQFEANALNIDIFRDRNQSISQVLPGPPFFSKHGGSTQDTSRSPKCFQPSSKEDHWAKIVLATKEIGSFSRDRIGNPGDSSRGEARRDARDSRGLFRPI